MKRSKSRTLISRTISRVKSRISSFGSLTESPNPLIAPPSISDPIATPTRASKSKTVGHRSHRAPEVDRRNAHVLGVTASPLVDGAVDASQSARPPIITIASLKVKTSTWTVFGTHPKFPATAYVNIDLDCEPSQKSIVALKEQEDDQTQHKKAVHQPDAGILYELSVQTSLTGPGVLIKQYGHESRQCMRIGERWLVVLHIGIKDTSLAARLSTSFRSLGGRLGRISNVEVINRWLDVLHRDGEKGREEMDTQQRLEVEVKVVFKHSALPRTTLCMEERTVEVALTEDEVERAKLEGVKLEGGEEEVEEDEERLREMRVLGAPWM
jgi:hypothetical protein